MMTSRLLREAVCNLGIPVVHVRRKVIEEHKRRGPWLAETPVDDLNISYLNEFIGSSFVCLSWHVGPHLSVGYWLQQTITVRSSEGRPSLLQPSGHLAIDALPGQHRRFGPMATKPRIS